MKRKSTRTNHGHFPPPVPQAEPTLSKRKDDDGRLPIHWAASANQLDITQLLAEHKGFDVDVQVRLIICRSRGRRWEVPPAV